MIPHSPEACKVQDFLPALNDLLAFVLAAAQQGSAAHEAELGLWKRLLALGHAAMAQFFLLQGTGDLGPQVTLPDGSVSHRLDDTHPRDYRSLFGDFQLQRTVYGSREGQKLDFVPLDNRLQLPASDYSYLLQQWDQTLGCESAFGRVAQTILDLLGLKQSVDSLEHMNRSLAEHVEDFRAQRPLPKPEDEGELVVAQADGKGIVMRRAADQPKIAGHRKKGEKPNQKRMACVGALYTINRHVRTAEEVVESLFHDPKRPRPKEPQRPRPVGKHVWASLSYEWADQEVEGAREVFGWLADELGKRNPGQAKETVILMDGQESLWEQRREQLPAKNSVAVLDLLHVTPRLPEAAHLFHPEGSDEAECFVRERLLGVLQGRVNYVVGGMRQMATKRGLSGAKRQRLTGILRYLKKNAHRMNYGEYLRKGYPIASGVIEGACRHYVKDRMERAGMHWTLTGAQAMLDVRSEYLNGDWEGFQRFRINRETERLYPHRQILDEVQWALAV